MKEFGWTPQELQQQSSKDIEELLFIISRVDAKIRADQEAERRKANVR